MHGGNPSIIINSIRTGAEMRITKSEARELEQLVNAQLQRGADLLDLPAVNDLEILANTGNLAGWKRLFRLQSRLREESISPNNEE